MGWVPMDKRMRGGSSASSASVSGTSLSSSSSSLPLLSAKRDLLTSGWSYGWFKMSVGRPKNMMRKGLMGLFLVSIFVLISIFFGSSDHLCLDPFCGGSPTQAILRSTDGHLISSVNRYPHLKSRSARLRPTIYDDVMHKNRSDGNVASELSPDNNNRGYQILKNGAVASASRTSMSSMSPFIMDNSSNPASSRVENVPYLDIRMFNMSSKIHNRMSFDEIFHDESQNSDHFPETFDLKSSDVMVFLHIQKTGGTSFGRHLVRDLDLETPCECKKGKKRCRCLRPSTTDSSGRHDLMSSRGVEETSGESNRYWLFSRYSMGWKCGLHADWTELTDGCVERTMDPESEKRKSGQKRRLFYITLLRDPISRFVSEWRHVQRGATWRSSIHRCGGRVPTDEELPECYSGQDWRGVRLVEFLSCHSNLAMNRQSRMLADLSLVGCYNQSVMSAESRDRVMLESAKANLKSMAYFGLCENQSVSQYLFESTFKLKFKRPFVQLNETHSSLALNEIEPRLLEMIRDANRLDLELYQFAKQLMFQRFQRLKDSDENFRENFDRVAKMIAADAEERSRDERRKSKILMDEARSSGQEELLTHDEEEDLHLKSSKGQPENSEDNHEDNHEDGGEGTSYLDNIW